MTSITREAPAQTAPEFASRAENLQNLLDAVDDAANTSFTLWVSYLFALFYLLIAVGSVTHRDLLLESPIKLPFLSVELPLVGFFWLGPVLFVIVHAYVLLHLVLLASKVGAFREQLQKQIPDVETQASLRGQLPNNFIVQLLAGPSDVQAGFISWMLLLIGIISLVVGPVALLLFFQAQFLPYHHDWVTWLHRAMVFIDLGILWLLWPSIWRGRISLISWRDLWRRKMIPAAATTLTALYLAFIIGTFPGEWLHDAWPTVRFVPTAWPSTEAAPQNKSEAREKIPLFTHLVRSMELSSLHELLVAGKVDPVTQRPESLWSNRLVVPYVDVIDRGKFDSDEKIAAARETRSLRGRHLEGAVLIGANLRKVDFTAAHLQGASLEYADLRGARFVCASRAARRDEIRRGADNAQSGARVTQQTDGSESEASADDCTNLKGASLDHAKLQGAFFDGAQLQGASLYYAKIQGAWLLKAKLEGALLESAQLQGAVLDGAQLQGAMLDNAYLQAAWLKKAQLQGASLDGTQLQGASLEQVEVDRTRFVEVFVWRAQPAFAIGSSTVRKVKADRKYRALDCPAWPKECEWSPNAFKVLEQSINEVPEGERREHALGLIKVLDPSKPDEKPVPPWREGNVTSDAEHLRARAEILRSIGCDLQGAPYVIRRFIKTFDLNIDRFFGDNPQLAAAFLNEAACPGARGLTKIDKARLADIRDWKFKNQEGSTVGSAGRR